MKTLILIASIATIALPAWAQKDAVKIEEKLGVAVVKKASVKAIKPTARKSAKAEATKPGEVLEIETKRGVKK